MFNGPPNSIRNKFRVGQVIVRVWGWFSYTGGGSIRNIPDNKSGNEDYISLLEDCLIPVAWARFGMKPVSFLYESKSFFPKSFSSPVVRSFFEDHPEVKAKSWPAKSRDLNPFATVWSDIENAIQLQRSQPKDILELFEIIEEFWIHRTSRPQFCKGLINSLKANIEKVRLAGGDSII